MRTQTLKIGSLIVVGIIAAVICVGMVTGFSVAKPLIPVDPVSDKNTGNAPGITGQYITIDPISDKTTGDLLIITGSTNLPAGTMLMIQAGNFGGNTEVNPGSNGVNRYSMPIDSSILEPGTQTITVINLIGDLAKEYKPGTVKETSTFTLKGTFLATESPVKTTVTGNDYIRLHAIGDRSVGDQFLITGTTSLPLGTMLLWQIMPDTGTTPAGVNETASGIAGASPVTKGDGIVNRVSFAADMSKQKPGKWVVLVGELKEGEFDMMGNPRGSASFILK